MKTRKKLTAEQQDILLLVKAAGGIGITVDGLLAQASAVRIVISPETAEAALRDLFRAGLATLRGDRWVVSAKGLAVCG
jgi:hypothetical protein